MATESVENSRKRRDRLYIIAEILAIARGGSLKTHIMYGANLSFAQLNEYLNFLLKGELLKADSDNKRTFYKTTSRGIKYLENYAEISNLLGREKGNPVKANSPIFWLKRTT